jgi:hypothetical protein
MLIQVLATWIPALLIGLPGVLKLSGNPKILETMTALGVGRHLRLLGIMELVFAALFVVPATMKLGFIHSCKRAGALVRTVPSRPDRAGRLPTADDSAARRGSGRRFPNLVSNERGVAAPSEDDAGD